MEAIDKYIYAVTIRLPQKQREDIRKELRGLIEDMLDERCGSEPPGPEDVDDVLLELGPPNEMADRYKGKKRYLISPLMFDSYWSTAKVVLASVSIGLSVIFAVETIVEPFSILDHFVKWIVSLITVNVQALGWVTLVFALIDYYRPADDEIEDKSQEWHPRDLPDIPDATKHIKLSEPIAGMVFIALLLVVCFYSVELVGVYTFRDGVRNIIPFLDAGVFNRYLPLIALAAVFGLLNEGLKLFARKRTGKLLIWNIILRSLSAGVLAIVFIDGSIWNPLFMEQLAASGLVAPGSGGFAAVEQLWNQWTRYFIIIIFIFLIIDIVTEAIRWYKAR
ncbi:hypothetical protein [Paenibacillus senegalensis]|uniref:hypothetical protein n=1 Tax=Paenibacillus senegalensis TaxID=1465766 RepID=UPI00028842D8|nr:hypothetical protein [Paenibacillus senegalensis]